MADTVRIKQACTLGHQPNLGEEVEGVEFEAGDELSVLQEWAEAYLLKNADGKLFNVPKTLVDPA